VSSAVGWALLLLVAVDGALIPLSSSLVHWEATFWGGWVAQMAASSAAGYVAARLAPRNNLRAGVSLALPATAFWVAHNVAAATNGVGTAQIGWSGNLAVAAVALGFNLVLCGIGAAAGDWHRDSLLEAVAENAPPAAR
jgi:hypothetical protein